MNNNENKQYIYGDYVDSISTLVKGENPIQTDDTLSMMMGSILTMCGWVDEYLQTHTKPDGENYYNRQEVIKYQDALNAFSQIFVDNTTNL